MSPLKLAPGGVDARRRRRSRRPVFTLVALLTASAALLGCRQKISPAQCDELVDHFAELVVREHMPDAGPEVIAAERERERRDAKNTDELRNCASQVQASEHACALKAQTSDAVLKCLE